MVFSREHPRQPNGCSFLGRLRSRLALEQLEDRCLLSADPILEWNAVALEANRVSYSGGVVNDQIGPTRSSRALAIVHVAMFDAWNSINTRFTPYLTVAPNADNASADAAVAQAAHDTLVALYPHQQALIDSALVQTLNRVPDGLREDRGVAVGHYVALGILQARSNDGSQVAGQYIPDGLAGHHDVDPLNLNQGFLGAAWGNVTPFAIPSLDVFPTRTAPGMGTAEYTTAFDQVKRLGELASTERTTDQTEIGIYWGYDVARGLGDPPRLYNQIARVIAQQQGNTVGENARLFALFNLAMADAGIDSWDIKYRDIMWRPIMAIRGGDADGNPDTLAQADWEPLGAPRTNPLAGETANFTPPFPAYISGHATFGGAVFKTLANFYQTDDIQFSIPFDFISDEFNGVSRDIYDAIPDLVLNHVRDMLPRHFGSFSQAAAENAASRIFLGIHWRFDATEGVSAGNRIADFTFDHFLRPTGGGPTHVPSVDFVSQIDAYLEGTYPSYFKSGSAGGVVELSPHERFLNQVYLDVLGRRIDGDGMTAWMSHLQQGMSRQEVVQRITNSTECRSLQINEAYHDLLNRDADPDGLAAWLGLLARGGTITDVRAGIAASPEFNSGADFLDRLYDRALSRLIDGAGRDIWSRALAAGVSRIEVAHAIFNSREFLGKEVDAIYEGFLGRAADPAGREAWLSVAQGGHDELVLAGILGSVEYFDHQVSQ